MNWNDPHLHTAVIFLGIAVGFLVIAFGIFGATIINDRRSLKEDDRSRKVFSGNWKILGVLALVGAASVIVSDDTWSICVLMMLAYLNNASYSMVSRSAVRDSAVYHAFTMLVSNVLWFTLLRKLITDNMTLALFVPYTVATVWGSFTGAKASMRVERAFGITTSTDKKKPSPRSELAKKALLVLMGGLAVLSAAYAQNIFASLAIAGLVFSQDLAFSLLRRSRNTSNTTYHIIASIVNSAVWYMTFRYLARAGMPFGLFLPFCFGSILGSLAGQKASAWVERRIGATADKQLESAGANFIPWKAIAALACVLVVCVAVSGDHAFLFYLAALSAAQQISFSLVSRSRNRSNMTYHIIASIFSNSVWFLTFRQLQVKNWTADLYIPYAVGGVIGSVTGVGVSMNIEKKLQIASEA